MSPPDRSGTREGERNGLQHIVVWGGVLVVGIAVALLAFHFLSPVDEAGNDAAGGLVEVDSITDEHADNHVHGIGYDEARDRLYVATHYGLFFLDDATGPADRLVAVGDYRNDLMGLSIEARDGDRMYASGHPYDWSPGEVPNIGVVRTTDGGFTWEEVWDGEDERKVDFHSMALSPADPDRLVGASPVGQAHFTLDAGASWRSLVVPGERGNCWGAVCLAWDVAQADRLWLANATHLLTSPDLGADWQRVAEGAHAALYAHPADGRLWAWRVGEGLAVTADAGANWTLRGAVLLETGSDVFQISGGPGDGDVLFAAMMNMQIHRSLDGGETWQRVFSLG